MKKLISTLFTPLTILCFAGSILLIATVRYAHSEAAPEGETYMVERVIDGHTIKLTNGERVRLIGIDTPEIWANKGLPLESQKELAMGMGKEVKELVKGFLEERQKVWLEFDVQQRDQYGRLLAYVWYKGGRTLKWSKESTEVCKIRVFDLKEVGTLIDKRVTEYETRYDYELENGCRYSYVDVMINAVIVYKGYATPMTMPPNVKYVDLFEELYDEAREEGRGLWQRKETAGSYLIKGSLDNF